ncbi:hypothetical protein RugamoR1_03140 [Rugamonas sp. R1(2021)]
MVADQPPCPPRLRHAAKASGNAKTATAASPIVEASGSAACVCRSAAPAAKPIIAIRITPPRYRQARRRTLRLPGFAGRQPPT